MYLLHNGTRRQNTRLLRAGAPTHAGMVQFVLKSQRRLIRGRPLQLSEEDLLENLKELQELQRRGSAYVTLLNRHVVDLFTLREKTPPPPAKTRPNFPLDSINRDTPVGVPMSPVDQPPPPSFVMPVDPPEAALENEEEGDEEFDAELEESDNDIESILTGATTDQKTSDTPQHRNNKKHRKNRR